MIHFLIHVLRLNVRYPSFIIINKYINTSVATVAIKGEFQAYMRRASGEGEGTKDVTGAQWQREHHVCKILRIGPSNSTCVICHLSLDWGFLWGSSTIDLRCTAWGQAAGLFWSAAAAAAGPPRLRTRPSWTSGSWCWEACAPSSTSSSGSETRSWPGARTDTWCAQSPPACAGSGTGWSETPSPAQEPAGGCRQCGTSWALLHCNRGWLEGGEKSHTQAKQAGVTGRVKAVLIQSYLVRPWTHSMRKKKSIKHVWVWWEITAALFVLTICPVSVYGHDLNVEMPSVQAFASRDRSSLEMINKNSGVGYYSLARLQWWR